jgi:hypothetical protein
MSLVVNYIISPNFSIIHYLTQLFVFNLKKTLFILLTIREEINTLTIMNPFISFLPYSCSTIMIFSIIVYPKL